MKKLLSFFLALVAGLAGGLLIGLLLAAVFTDRTAGEVVDKAMDTSLAEAVGVPLFSLVSLAVAVVLHLVLHEAGHLVFGLASGYRFLSFRVFNIAVVNEGGRLGLKRFAVAGTGGQCLMTPPDVPAEGLPVVAYNLGGLAVNLLICLVCIAGIFSCTGRGHAVTPGGIDLTALAVIFLAFTALVGFIVILLNGIPTLCVRKGMY